MRDWQPDLAIDHHEYGPGVPVLYDDELLYLWPRNLNVDRAVHDLALSFSKETLAPCAADAGFTSDEYGLYAAGPVDVTQTAGDGDEGIMRNLMGLRHSLGILIESAVSPGRDERPGESSTAAAVNRRRVESHATVIDCAAASCEARGHEVAATTAGSVTRKIVEGRDRSAPVYFQGQDEDTTAAQDAPATVSINPPPCGYDLTTAQVDEARRSPRPAWHHDRAATRWRAGAARASRRAGHRALARRPQRGSVRRHGHAARHLPGFGRGRGSARRHASLSYAAPGDRGVPARNRQ